MDLVYFCKQPRHLPCLWYILLRPQSWYYTAKIFIWGLAERSSVKVLPKRVWIRSSSLIMMAPPARPLSMSKLLERINNYHCQMSNVCWPAMTIPASMACALLCAYWAGRLSVPGTPPVDWLPNLTDVNFQINNLTHIRDQWPQLSLFLY